ncbi:MAG: hypothetical protein ACXADA_05500 [Candidatus Hodarchaeales archaeon]
MPDKPNWRLFTFCVAIFVILIVSSFPVFYWRSASYDGNAWFKVVPGDIAVFNITKIYHDNEDYYTNEYVLHNGTRVYLTLTVSTTVTIEILSVNRDINRVTYSVTLDGVRLEDDFNNVLLDRYFSFTAGIGYWEEYRDKNANELIIGDDYYYKYDIAVNQTGDLVTLDIFTQNGSNLEIDFQERYISTGWTNRRYIKRVDNNTLVYEFEQVLVELKLASREDNSLFSFLVFFSAIMVAVLIFTYFSVSSAGLVKKV